MHDFWLCFVPIFVAVDPVGILPLFMGLTEKVERAHMNRLIIRSVITAIIVSVAFLLGGRWLFDLIGITVEDFMVAGGVLLFVLSMTDLVITDARPRRTDPETVGAVPIGVPLLAGPAVFATAMLLLNQFGYWLTALALVANMVLAGLVFRCSSVVLRVLGVTGTKIVAKVAALILAAFSVMLIRKGVASFLS